MINDFLMINDNDFFNDNEVYLHCIVIKPLDDLSTQTLRPFKRFLGNFSVRFFIFQTTPFYQTTPSSLSI